MNQINAMNMCATLPNAGTHSGLKHLNCTYPVSFVHNGYDVTDNKTSEALTLLPWKQEPYIMNDKYNREDERLKTFDNWPLVWLNKRDLAQMGLFYTGEDDKVKCYFCEVEIGKWEQDDQPLTEHLRFSPNCPLLRRRTTNNVPLNVEALNRMLPPISYDICGNEGIESRSNTLSEGVIPADRLPRSTASPYPTDCQVYRHEFPEYAIETARLRSFADWPIHMKQKPDQLAEAGFFYTGVGDRVKCFSCGGGLKDWDDCDEPWEQHALWLSHCRYVKLIKGQSYIDGQLALQKAKAAEGAASVDEVPTTTRAACSGSTSSAAFAGETKPQLDKLEIKAPTCIPEDKLCKICYAAEYNTAFLPCGHVVACAKCASSVDKCPLCRKPFENVMRVYFS